MSGRVAPTGRQVEITAGAYRAVSTEVGAGLRTMTVGDRALIDGFAAGEACTAARGQVLAPWPNRIADGRYEFGGHQEQLALTQPTEGHAIHGLTRWSNWRCAVAEPASVTWELRLHPQPGYPHTLDLAIRYTVDADLGLEVGTTATNVGGRPAPFGVGFHPYVTAGSPTIDDDELVLPAGQVLLTDRRAIPDGLVAVTEVDLDFRPGRRLGRLPLDHGFGGLSPDPGDGRTHVVLRGDGGTTALWADPAFRWLQLFTGDSLGPDHARRAVAIEPMTCPANAFVSGADVLVLEPGERFEAAWGLRGAEWP